MQNKKGTEKPIEIFVALFVVLAVALVMLKLFQNQVTQQQSEIDEIKQNDAQEELFQNAKTYCQDKCSQATSNNCAADRLASLCIAYGSDVLEELEYLDLNQDGLNNYDETYLVGVGVCEDRVPCHVLIDRCCSQKINYNTCNKILKDYWEQSLNLDADQIESKFASLIDPGDCYSDLSEVEKASHWYDVGNYEATFMSS